MRGSKAKRLRREAEARTIGQPAVIYHQPFFNTLHHWNPQLVMAKCTRALYKRLKRASSAKLN